MQVNKFLGFGSRNDVSQKANHQMYPKDEWDNDFKLWVIGSDYCSARRFKTNHNEICFFVISKMHKKMLSSVINKCLTM